MTMLSYENRRSAILGPFLQFLEGQGYPLETFHRETYDLLIMMRLFDMFMQAQQQEQRIQAFVQAMRLNMVETIAKDANFRDLAIQGLRARPVEEREGIVNGIRLITPTPAPSPPPEGEGKPALVVLPGGKTPGPNGPTTPVS